MGGPGTFGATVERHDDQVVVPLSVHDPGTGRSQVLNSVRSGTGGEGDESDAETVGFPRGDSPCRPAVNEAGPLERLHRGLATVGAEVTGVVVVHREQVESDIAQRPGVCCWGPERVAITCSLAALGALARICQNRLEVSKSDVSSSEPVAHPTEHLRGVVGGKDLVVYRPGPAQLDVAHRSYADRRTGARLLFRNQGIAVSECFRGGGAVAAHLQDRSMT